MRQDQEGRIMSWINQLAGVSQLHSRSAGREGCTDSGGVHIVADGLVPEASLTTTCGSVERCTSGKPLTFANIEAAFPDLALDPQEDSVRGEKAHDEQVLLESHYGYLGRKIIRVPEIILTEPREDPETDDSCSRDPDNETSSKPTALVATVERVKDIERAAFRSPRRRGSFEHTQPVPNIMNLILWSAGSMSITDALIVWNMLKQARRLERHCGDIPAAVEVLSEDDEGYESDSCSQLPLHARMKGVREVKTEKFLHVDMYRKKLSAGSFSGMGATAGIVMAADDDDIKGGSTTVPTRDHRSPSAPEDEVLPGLMKLMRYGVKEDIISYNFGPFLSSATAKRRTIDIFELMGLCRAQNTPLDIQSLVGHSVDIFVGSARLPDIVPPASRKSVTGWTTVSVIRPISYRHEPTPRSLASYSISPLPHPSHPSPPYLSQDQSSFIEPYQSLPFEHLPQDYSLGEDSDHQQPLLDIVCEENMKGNKQLKREKLLNATKNGESWLNLSSSDEDATIFPPHHSTDTRHQISTDQPAISGFQNTQASTFSSPTSSTQLESAISERSSIISHAEAAAEQRIRKLAIESPTTAKVKGLDTAQTSLTPQVRSRKNGSEARYSEKHSPRLEGRKISVSMRNRIEAIEKKQISVRPLNTPDRHRGASRETENLFSPRAYSTQRGEQKREVSSSDSTASLSGEVTQHGELKPSAKASITKSVNTSKENHQIIGDNINRFIVNQGSLIGPADHQPCYVDRFIGEGTNPQQSVAYFLACKELGKQVALEESRHMEGSVTGCIEEGDGTGGLYTGARCIGVVEHPKTLDSRSPLGRTADGTGVDHYSTFSHQSEIGIQSEAQSSSAHLIADNISVDFYVGSVDSVRHENIINTSRSPTNTEFASDTPLVLQGPGNTTLKVFDNYLPVSPSSGSYGTISPATSSAQFSSSSTDLLSTQGCLDRVNGGKAREITPWEAESSDSLKKAPSSTQRSVSIGYQQESPMIFFHTPTTTGQPRPSLLQTCKRVLSRCFGVK